ncbi:unnamed protein product [Ixodes hexagonus]
METCVAQVTNVAPTATLEQMSTLFGFLGKILELKMYPSDEFLLQPVAKVCYVRYEEPWSVGVAQHLTNTVFVDRALIVVPVADGKLPDESRALALTTPVSTGPEEPTVAALSPGLINQVAMGAGGVQVITTQDPQLAALGLPPYPPLPATMDPTKVEEIRRTVYVGNLDSSATTEQLLKFFSQMGEVKYVRMAGGESQPTRFAFVEFTEQSSVGRALQFNGIEFAGRSLKINHSNNSIVKPQAKSSEAAHKEIEEAMRRRRSKSPSKPRRSRSRSSRSRSSRRRSRSSSRRRLSRSGSRHRRSHRRSRSRPSSPGPRRRRRSSSRDRRRYSRSRTPPKRSRLKSRRDEFPETSRRRKKSRSPSSRKSSKRPSGGNGPVTKPGGLAAAPRSMSSGGVSGCPPPDCSASTSWSCCCSRGNRYRERENRCRERGNRCRERRNRCRERRNRCREHRNRCRERRNRCRERRNRCREPGSRCRGLENRCRECRNRCWQLMSQPRELIL